MTEGFLSNFDQRNREIREGRILTSDILLLYLVVAQSDIVGQIRLVSEGIDGFNELLTSLKTQAGRQTDRVSSTHISAGKWRGWRTSDQLVSIIDRGTCH